MLSRDLVLRVCASTGDFRDDWLAGRRGAAKSSVPFPVPPVPDEAFAAAVAGAAAEMGAEALLVCRTRAAFMYDPVTEAPANRLALLELLARWQPPAGFLVCLPDESAAVLVSAAGYAIGAGPPAFIAALAGPDLEGARERFTAWAYRHRNRRLWQVAARHGAERPGDRPFRPDIAERMQRLTRATTQRPGLIASLRFLRAAVGWEALAVIVLTMLSAARASHVLPVIGLACWLVFQVFVLARTHTLSWAACLRMTAAGAVCGVLLAAAQRLASGHAVTALAASPALTGRAWAAPAEEAAKLVPLAVFWAAARNRAARLAAVDFLLLGVAAGAGFGLAGGTAAALTTPGTGWHLAALLPGWTDAGGLRFPGQAVTTGLVGAGIGLAAVTHSRLAHSRPAHSQPGRWRRWAVWLVPMVLFAWAVLDHLGYGAAVSGARIPGWAARLHAVTGNGHESRWLLVALLAACVAVDYRAIRSAAGTAPPLPGVPLWAGLARTARGAMIDARLGRPEGAAPGRAAARLRLVQAGTRLGAAEAAVEAGHEFALILAAAPFRRAPRRLGPLPAALAFVRERRELAMGAARAGGREPQGAALRAALWPAWQRLGATLRLAGFAALAVLAAARPGNPVAAGLRRPLVSGPWLGHLVAAGGLRRFSAPRLGYLVPAGGAGRFPVSAARRGPTGHAIDLTDRLGPLHHWFSQFPPGGQWLIVAAGIGVLTLLVSGWALPGDGQLAGPGRDPEPSLRTLTRGLPPARLPLTAFQLAGALLPRADRLLAGQPVARPYRWPGEERTGGGRR